MFAAMVASAVVIPFMGRQQPRAVDNPETLAEHEAAAGA